MTKVKNSKGKHSHKTKKWIQIKTLAWSFQTFQRDN